jgi:tetratricopeptide (TPR) repeat protein
LLAFVFARPWILAAVLAIVTVAVYAPVRHHPFFTMDDEAYVVNNAHLRNSSFGETLGWAFTSYDLANWHPVTWLSHAADVQMFHLDPAGHHDVNLLLHTLNAVLLFWIFLSATGYAGRSFMVAALFALHPVNVETVAWVSQRKTILSVLFFLLALAAYRWYVQKPRIGRYAVVGALYLLGLMAKPQVITFPFVLLLWDYWPLRRMFASSESGNGSIPPQKFLWLVLEKVPLLVLSALSGILTMAAQGSAGPMQYYPLPFRLGNAVVSYARYIGKAFWPSTLAVFYPHPELTLGYVTMALLLLLAITTLVLQQQTRRYLAVGWFWFLGTLVPMIGIVQVGEQAMADRYAYLSFIGIFVMVCWSAGDFFRQRQLSPVWPAAGSVAVLLTLCVLTRQQLSYWSDNVRLWTRMQAISSASYEVEENLGVALLERRQPEAAMHHFQQVIDSVPTVSPDIGRELAGYASVAHLYVGAYDLQHGQPAVAILHYKKVLDLAQSFAAQNNHENVPPVLTRMKAAALGNMGDAYYAMRDLQQAKDSYEAALLLDSHSAREWIGLGIVEQKSGDLPTALRAYARAAQIQPSPVGLLLLAQALDQSGRREEAESARRQASMMTENFAAAQQAVNQIMAQ